MKITSIEMLMAAECWSWYDITIDYDKTSEYGIDQTDGTIYRSDGRILCPQDKEYDVVKFAIESYLKPRPV